MNKLIWIVAGAGSAYLFALYRAFTGLTHNVDKFSIGSSFDGPAIFLTVTLYNGGVVSTRIRSFEGTIKKGGVEVGTVSIPDGFFVQPGGFDTVTVMIKNIKLPVLDLMNATGGLSVTGKAVLPFNISVPYETTF